MDKSKASSSLSSISSSSSTNSRNIRNSILSGSISGCLTAIIFQPFEFIKTKLQQPTYSKCESINKKTKIRLIIYSTLTSKDIKAINGLVEVNVFDKNKIHLRNLTRFWTDLIKTRYESDFYNYRSLSNAFGTIIGKEGFFGLYKGLSATLIRDATYSGIYFTMYNKVKQLSSMSYEKQSKDSIYFASCALISGMVACLITQPPDVIRSYMQLDPVNYKSFTKTAKFIYETKGVAGFMSGFLPRSSRRVLISIMSWTLYEKISISS